MNVVFFNEVIYFSCTINTVIDTVKGVWISKKFFGTSGNKRLDMAAKTKGFLDLLRSLWILKWCPGRDLNPHDRFGSRDFKSLAYAYFATRACELFGFIYYQA